MKKKKKEKKKKERKRKNQKGLIPTFVCTQASSGLGRVKIKEK